MAADASTKLEQAKNIVRGTQQESVQRLRTAHVNIVDERDLKKAEQQFQITGDKEDVEMIAGGKNYMDKSVEITPENILSSVEEVYQEYKTDKGTREAILSLFRKLATGAWVPASLLGGARMAYAADESGLATAAADVAAKYSPAGNVSYTTFLKGVQEHMIERVRIDPTGRTAEFLNVDGARGMVNLFNDPNLLKILQENKIDISVTP